MTTATDLAQQAIDNIKALKALAEKNGGIPADVQAQLDAYAKQVDKLTRQLGSEQETREGYRVNILIDAEEIGLALEIMNKIEAGLGDNSIPQMHPTLRRQLTETLGYVTNRQKELLSFRKEGDSEPRTYEEYRMGI
ncbi:hypothetical protein HFD87_10240 [Pantoea sp. EKM21T]|uniref:hypothetical protein n=1 Tax=unclassified Pantoea TaxID=2630326 RepID=UPI00142E1799|nr:MULTISPECIES: hypothetical protein [unclassified Pantoea]KAF6676843.1 hypothetical protein HFD87_10240 [Pantoea sp. EKM21T]KAF6685991.1 hypothetical protein HFD90_03845 [Pantoea sp. EKM22T]